MQTRIVGTESFTDYTTIQEAIDSLSHFNEEEPKKIIILEGVYKEQIISRLSTIHFIGLGEVIIQADKSAKMLDNQNQPLTTFRTATMFIEGEHICLENLTIKNTAGPGHMVEQAVALFNNGHQTQITHCRLEGFQDTLCLGPLPNKQKDGSEFVTPIVMNRSYCRQVYTYTYIEGTIDFIFGGADAYFLECQLDSLSADKTGYVTAASTPEEQKEGFLFEKCYLTSEKNLGNIYLGRPWRPFAKTTFAHCFFGEHIANSGWDLWGDPNNARTIVYTEQACIGNNHERPSWVVVR